ncbi:uncharacterized protein LOC106140374 [Amyelois transitella]|uniref:uncharacterized protein LOC106140374 n=1 Tax=Amyelois transitella TaxID=680683 RepID=UPI00067C7670|nr:uncharacterized protein LOC106140374 [Amyelois transitella]
MLFSKCILTILLLNIARESSCKPMTDEYITEARGIGSTLWGWITYPFSWWSSGEPAPVNDQLIGSTTLGPYDNIEVERHNVTVWCNDQTCTTMRCDKYGCKNTTCNIYDTDMKGQCREYVTKPDEPAPTISSEATNSSQTSEVTEATQKLPSKPDIVTNAPEIKPVVVTNNPETSQAVDERPLELEAVLSSTVTEANVKDPQADVVNSSVYKA